VLFRYREIIFGIFIGLVVFLLDTFMDAANEALSFTEELGRHPSMVFYRSLFVVAGFILGWLLWQRNKTARDFVCLQESLDQLRHECEKRSLLLHSSLQVLLTRTDFHLPAEAEQLVRRAYESSQEIQTLVR
jgi:H+/Cl- antiporter ClcA